MVCGLARVHGFLELNKFLGQLHIEHVEHTTDILLVLNLLPERLIFVEWRKLLNLQFDLLDLLLVHEPVAVLAAALLDLLATYRLEVVLLDEALGVVGSVLLDDEGLALAVVVAGDDPLPEPNLSKLQLRIIACPYGTKTESIKN